MTPKGLCWLFILINNLYFIYTKINYDKIKLITGFIAVASSSSFVFRFNLCLAKLRAYCTLNNVACEQPVSSPFLMPIQFRFIIR